MNGIQEVGEPNLPGLLIELKDADGIFVDDLYSDANGNYSFGGLADGSYIVWFFKPDGYAVTLPQAGSDATLDSDATETGITGVMVISGGNPFDHIDAGFYQLSAGINLSMRVNAYANSPAYVTNDAWVTLTYIVTNTGNVHLSSVMIYDISLDDIVGFLDCPALLAPGASYSTSRLFQVSGDMQIDVEAAGFAVDYKTCGPTLAFPDLDVAESSFEIIVFSSEGDDDEDGMPNDWEIKHGLNPAVSNAPDSNADGDWMTDFQEFIADTDPQNSLSFFPFSTYSNNAPGEIVHIAISTTSPARAYHVIWTTNMLEQPRKWVVVPPEVTGTGSAVSFILTNSGYYKTGVRLIP